MSIYFIGGDEPYLVEVKRISLVGKLALPELNYIASESLDADVLNHLYTTPIGDEERVAFVKLQHLKEADNPFLKEYLSCPAGKLIVQFREYDSRSNFFKELKKMGRITLCNKEDALPSLRAYIEKKAAQRGFSFTDSAMNIFMERIDYGRNEDMNLYGILGYMSSLSALGHTVTEEMVRSVVPAHFNENIFGIAKMIMSGDVNGLRIQASLLKDSPIETLGALLREYRIAYKSKYYSQKEIGVNACILSGKDKHSLSRAIDLITNQIAAIKHGATGELVLTETFLRLI